MSMMRYSYLKVSGDYIPYQHRDISWLNFNYRVLQEAKDANTPLLERIKFLAIYSNNLDEFFRVRVANNRNLIRVGKKTKKHFEFDPEQIQSKIISIVNKQQLEFDRIFKKEIIPACREHNIHFVNERKLSDEHNKFIDDYFNDYMVPFVQPILLQENKIKPFFNNASLYLSIHLRDKKKPNIGPQYAVVKIPCDQLPRFISLPSKTNQKFIIFLDDIVRSRIHYFFPGYDIIESYSLKLSRDADLYIDDEFSGNLVAKIKKNLSKRNVGPASRLVYDRKMPKHMLVYFSSILEVSAMDLFKEGRYHNNFDFFQFPSFNYNHLKNKKLKPISISALEKSTNIFENIKNRDYLVHVPYHSYESPSTFPR